MIWYEVGRGNISIPDTHVFKLVCTDLSLKELAFSPKNLTNLTEVQSAIRAILNSRPEIILSSPIEHAKTLVDKDYSLDDDIEPNLTLAFLRALLHSPKEGIIDNSFRNHLERISSIRKANMTKHADFLNDLYDSPYDVKRALKKYSPKGTDKDFLKQMLLNNLNEFDDSTFVKDDFPWELFELYISVGAQHMRKLVISSMKSYGNDDYDLRNMIYVQPGDKYWTLEKKWVNLIKEANLEKYLYFE